jgi:phosphopantothenoylcysteine decarboxylase/phosphopantothenate--cysteine ligase
MTRSASEFIGATTFQALTGRDVHTALFGASHALDHIRLAQRAELTIIAPATADFMARLVHGRADDLLAAAVLAAHAPVLVVPAMNDHMWSKPATQRNVAQLRADGFLIIDPETGPLAAGEGEGPGRMAEPATILARAARALTEPTPLSGMKVIVTAGATREAIDPVRFISNHSSGRMGVALAAAAGRRGAEVTLIGGAMSVEPPAGVTTIRVQTTEQMATAVRDALAEAGLLIMAAAPADFRPDHAEPQKLDKREAPPTLNLVAATDILKSTMDARPKKCLVVGFALETSDARKRARKKLEEKKLDMIVVNDATEPGAGFTVDTNRVSLLIKGGAELELPLLHKDDVSEIILDKVEELLNGGG